VLLSTPLHASSNFTVSVQLANKRGFKQKKSIKLVTTNSVTCNVLKLGFQRPGILSDRTKQTWNVCDEGKGVLDEGKFWNYRRE
jgi:hypothetical protein